MSAVKISSMDSLKEDKIIKFAGCYHGHSDSFWFRQEVELLLAHHVAQVTAGTAKDTLLATYNDLENVSAGNWH
jgi:glutamate-1-semialdehyde 2,1-aminomutase